MSRACKSSWYGKIFLHILFDNTDCNKTFYTCMFGIWMAFEIVFLQKWLSARKSRMKVVTRYFTSPKIVLQFMYRCADKEKLCRSWHI